MAKSLSIGILGTRGIPNQYGGFEQCAEYLALGLVQKGHKVWVYNSANHEYKEAEWQGVNIIHCTDPEPKLGTFGQFIYDKNCIEDARKRQFDILLQLGYTSNSIWFFRWPKRPINVVNMDGLEWKRSKYNKWVRTFLKYAEKLAAVHADALVADSTGIQHYLLQTYRKQSYFIPYGADVFSNPDVNCLAKYKLLPFQYTMLMARMEPENNIEMIIRGYIESGSKVPLLVVGKTENSFGTFLKNEFSDFKQIVFLGGIYNKEIINNLRYYSWLYFHGHSVGGTNPSLLEAMACNSLILAHDNVFNKSVLENDAFYFSNKDQLAEQISQLQPKENYVQLLQNNVQKIQQKYNWQTIVDAYENVFVETLNKQG